MTSRYVVTIVARLTFTRGFLNRRFSLVLGLNNLFVLPILDIDVAS